MRRHVGAFRISWLMASLIGNERIERITKGGNLISVKGGGLEAEC
jgi:hypothetical protein